ncbi:hypothetical protein LIER_17102 [Lithospermum erythrorhizon]|uniref:Reverse transcriptase Ty1/copia-type domain-containing protein n=1 Tax=Lithospermum erythrorhizon TaxID=34254 RepID=A0AAV3QCD4_LITER
MGNPNVLSWIFYTGATVHATGDFVSDFMCGYAPIEWAGGANHLQLLHVARALMFQEHALPSDFWGECVLGGSYLINRTPSRILQFKSSYEILYRTSATYDNWLVFGCLCYACDLNTRKDKFSSRSHKWIFVGYPLDKKGSKLFDLECWVYFVSRHVTFYEFEFPGVSDSPELFSESNGVLYEVEGDFFRLDEPPLGSMGLDVSPPTSLDGAAPNHEPARPLSTEEAAASEVAPSLAKVAAAPQEALLGRGQRERVTPRHLRDYVLHIVPHSSPPPLASTSPHYSSSLYKKALGSRWVYKIKYKFEGSVERLKARLFLFRNHQTEGINYSDTFALVAKISTVRAFLAIAAVGGWEFHQMDVHNDFLHCDLQEEVHMKPPPGFKQGMAVVAEAETRPLGCSSLSGAYLKNSPGQSILLHSDSDLTLSGWCDSDWASGPMTHRSITRWLVFLGGSPIFWKTKKQKTVSLSSAEADYRSLTALNCELKWLKGLLLGLGVFLPILFRCTVIDGTIIGSHVSTTSQLADFFTKPLRKH